ncbi:MAG TPA: hypothetical protein VF200_06180 [Woeseiaceae bacterium]
MLESRRAGETSVFERVDAVAARLVDDAMGTIERDNPVLPRMTPAPPWTRPDWAARRSH